MQTKMNLHNFSCNQNKSFHTSFFSATDRLGNEKYKSKNSYRARWLEQFDLHLFDEDQSLEVVVCGKYNVYGKSIIDLKGLPRESTHGLWQVSNCQFTHSSQFNSIQFISIIHFHLRHHSNWRIAQPKCFYC